MTKIKSLGVDKVLHPSGCSFKPTLYQLGNTSFCHPDATFFLKPLVIP
ncbi:hypothetical protein [Legionella quinlivanii]|nr:hypothetical protein [Legionella quinlivanii]